MAETPQDPAAAAVKGIPTTTTSPTQKAVQVQVQQGTIKDEVVNEGNSGAVPTDAVTVTVPNEDESVRDASLSVASQNCNKKGESDNRKKEQKMGKKGENSTVNQAAANAELDQEQEAPALVAVADSTRKAVQNQTSNENNSHDNDQADNYQPQKARSTIKPRDSEVDAVSGELANYLQETYHLLEQTTRDSTMVAIKKKNKNDDNDDHDDDALQSSSHHSLEMLDAVWSLQKELVKASAENVGHNATTTTSTNKQSDRATNDNQKTATKDLDMLMAPHGSESEVVSGEQSFLQDSSLLQNFDNNNNNLLGRSSGHDVSNTNSSELEGSGLGLPKELETGGKTVNFDDSAKQHSGPQKSPKGATSRLTIQPRKSEADAVSGELEHVLKQAYELYEQSMQDSALMEFDPQKDLLGPSDHNRDSTCSIEMLDAVWSLQKELIQAAEHHIHDDSASDDSQTENNNNNNNNNNNDNSHHSRSDSSSSASASSHSDSTDSNSSSHSNGKDADYNKDAFPPAKINIDELNQRLEQVTDNSDNDNKTFKDQDSDSWSTPKPEKETANSDNSEACVAVSSAVAMWDAKKPATGYKTPISKTLGSEQSRLDALSTGNTAVTEASTVASLTPPNSSDWRMQPSNLRNQFESKTPSSISSQGPSSLRGTFGSTPQKQTASFAPTVSDAASTPRVDSPYAEQDIQDGPSSDSTPPKNEFQMVQLRKSTKMVEKHIKESKLEFAEMIANTLIKKSPNRETSLEVLRHMDDLKQEVALLQEEEDATLWAINKLRKELLDMFSQGGPMQEEYLLRWILPLQQERDPKTGRLIMTADQVAMLQSFSTSQELTMVSALGMVRSVLQSNFKAINGVECLQAIHDYACFRLGKKPKRAPQNPWDVLAELFEKAQDGDSTEDIHQRVCNALVLWVVREILGTTQDKVTSRSCFHAIYLVASLKLELQRLAPAALEQGSSIELLDHAANAEDIKPTPKSSVRAPIVEKILQSDAWTGGSALSSSSGPTGVGRGASSGTCTMETLQNEGGATGLYTPDTRHEAGAASVATSSKNEGRTESFSDEQKIAAAVSSFDPSKVRGSSIDRDEAMREAMIARDSSRKGVSEVKREAERIPERDLPKDVQDSHRVIRTILGPNNPHVNVSHCFEAIRLYSSLIVQWKEASERNQYLLETSKDSAASRPSLEEEKLKALEQRIRLKADEPPPMIELGNHDDGQPDVQESEVDNVVDHAAIEPLQGQEEEPDVEGRSDHQVVESVVPQSDSQDQVKAKRSIAVPKSPKEATASKQEPPRTQQPHHEQEDMENVQKSVRAKAQKTAEATQAQAKTRTRLMSRLRHIKLTGTHKSKSTRSVEADSISSDGRDPNKRRARWTKKIFGN